MTAAENCTFAQINDVNSTRQSFVVASHMRPDGDALGSALALGIGLISLGKTVAIWNESGLSDKFKWLPGSELLVQPPAQPTAFDTAFILDTATLQRVGTPAKFIQSPVWINIDHHISNERFGNLVHIDSNAPATGQIIFELLQALKIPVDTGMAENLFVAISTDTGSFQYRSTTARTFEIGAALIRAGADVSRISRDLYESYSFRRIQLLRLLLNDLIMTRSKQVAAFSLSLADAEKLEATPEDHDGLIDHVRAIEGVQVAAFFEELAEGRVRVSMRSKDLKYNVCTICQVFGGGGHALASGARIAGSLVEVREKVLKEIDDEITRNT